MRPSDDMLIVCTSKGLDECWREGSLNAISLVDDNYDAYAEAMLLLESFSDASSLLKGSMPAVIFR